MYLSLRAMHVLSPLPVQQVISRNFLSQLLSALGLKHLKYGPYVRVFARLSNRLSFFNDYGPCPEVTILGWPSLFFTQSCFFNSYCHVSR